MNTTLLAEIEGDWPDRASRWALTITHAREMVSKGTALATTKPICCQATTLFVYMTL